MTEKEMEEKIEGLEKQVDFLTDALLKTAISISTLTGQVSQGMDNTGKLIEVIMRMKDSLERYVVRTDN